MVTSICVSKFWCDCLSLMLIYRSKQRNTRVFSFHGNNFQAAQQSCWTNQNVCSCKKHMCQPEVWLTVCMFKLHRGWNLAKCMTCVSVSPQVKEYEWCVLSIENIDYGDTTIAKHKLYQVVPRTTRHARNSYPHLLYWPAAQISAQALGSFSNASFGEQKDKSQLSTNIICA